MTELHIGSDYLEQLLRVRRKAEDSAVWARVHVRETVADVREQRQRLLAITERIREKGKA